MAAREDWGHARRRTAFGSRFNAQLHGHRRRARVRCGQRPVQGSHWPDAIATDDVQERIRQRLLHVFVRVCLLAEDAARAMGQ